MSTHGEIERPDASVPREGAGRVVASGPPAPTVETLRRAVASCPPDELPELLTSLDLDPRAGVRALARATRARLRRERVEIDRLDRLMARQLELHALGLSVIAGVDEVGRGALAGPVTTCAIVLPASSRIPGLDDSKRIPRERRPAIAAAVRAEAIAVCVAHASPAEIDSLGIGPATRLAWRRCIDGLGIAVDHVLVDGNDAALHVPATAVVGGDARIGCIAAASVVAKVERDALMEGLALLHPGYGFELNRGYGTVDHMAALASRGPSAVHRRSFAPCAEQTTLFK